MKIRNKFLIPMLAILLTALMIGSTVSGVAADTTAATTEDPASHPLTYIPSTFAPTSSFEEELDAMLSEKLTNLDGVGEDIRDASGEAGSILRTIRDFLNKIVEFFKKVGEFLGGGFTSILPTTQAPEETTAQ